MGCLFLEQKDYREEIHLSEALEGEASQHTAS